jgi:hypothetical protein
VGRRDGRFESIRHLGRQQVRGDLFTSWLKFKFNSQLYGHFLAEYFVPGSYYDEATNDDAWWFRFNVEYVF